MYSNCSGKPQEETSGAPGQTPTGQASSNQAGLNNETALTNSTIIFKDNREHDYETESFTFMSICPFWTGKKFQSSTEERVPIFGV